MVKKGNHQNSYRKAVTLVTHTYDSQDNAVSYWVVSSY